MKNQIWLNLPVKDLEKAKQFYTAIGGRFNPGPGNSEFSACLVVGKQDFVIMLFTEARFADITRSNPADTAKGVELLISLDAASRQEVDEMAKLVEQAGGSVFSKPQEVQGWMYGLGFSDPDGHRWNMLYMDHAQLPKA